MAMARQVAQHGARWNPRGKHSSSTVPEVCSEVVGAVGKVASAASAKRPRTDCAGLGAGAYPAAMRACVLALILLDSAYNWLLYECSSVQKPAVPGASAVPHPHVYFTLFAGPWEPALNGTNLPRLVARFVGDAPAAPQQGDEPQTLKRGDPACEALQARWRESVRTFACRMYAFAVPTAEAIAVLKRHCPLVEVGAGTGYWASLVRQAGGDITALDSQPPDSGHNEYHGRCTPWSSVRKGPLEGHEHGRALFLCYPPPDSNMAEAAVAKYAGGTVLYVGEWDGDTGTAALQHRLLSQWDLAEVVPLPNWGDTCYELMVWKRRGGIAALPNGQSLATGSAQPLERAPSVAGSSSGRQVSELMPLGVLCAVCGARGTQDSPLWRCRQTCCCAFCSDKCLQLAMQSMPAALHSASGQVGHKPQRSDAGCSSSCKRNGRPDVMHAGVSGVPERLGSYADELSVRHCRVDAGALQLADSRLYRRCPPALCSAGSEQRGRHAGGENRRGSSKKQSRKKRRKR